MSAASAAPILFNGYAFNALAANSPLLKMLAASNSDRVIVFIQLHGGNDGLNTVIPITNHTEYQLMRANIAIPKDGDRKLLVLDPDLPDEQKVGVHPDMTGFQEMFLQKRASIVRDVGYDNMNMSHFRSRDIWFMGGDYNERYKRYRAHCCECFLVKTHQ